MSRTALALCAGLLVATAAAAQDVRITVKDGPSVSGALESFEQGRYKVRLADGSVRDVEERLVLDIVLLPRAERGPAVAPGPVPGVQAAFDRGDLDGALRLAIQAQQAMDAERAVLADLTRRTAQALLERDLERRDAAALGDHLRRLVPVLPADARQALVARLAGRFGELSKTAPEEQFTGAFADVLARLADEGTVSPEARTALADVFARLAEGSAQRREWSPAVALYLGAGRVDPKRRDSLKTALAQATLALGQRRLEIGDAAGAQAAARDLLAMDAKSPEARRLVEDAEFAGLKQEVDADYGAEAGGLLRNFIAKTLRAEHKAWAEAALARQTGPSTAAVRAPDVAAQMRKYYPIRPGRFVLYKRADGEIQERIRTDAVTRVGDSLRVTFTLKETYKEHTKASAYTVEIERDAVLTAVAGGEREPLLRFPLRPGDAWTWTSSQGREFRRVVKSLGETVRTGEGATERVWTDCLIVDFTSVLDRDGAPVSITSRSSYAPGVGLVKLEFLDAEFRRFNLDLVRHGIE